MWSVLVPCSDAIVIYSCLSYTSVVLYLSASKSLTLTSVILHIHVSNYYTCSISTFTAPNSSSSDSNESNVSEYTLLQVEVQQLLSPRREIGTLFKYCVIRRVHSTLYFRVTPCPANLPSNEGCLPLSTKNRFEHVSFEDSAWIPLFGSFLQSNTLPYSYT